MIDTPTAWTGRITARRALREKNRRGELYMSKKQRSLRALFALLFAGLISISTIACEEDLGDELEDVGDEIEDAVD
jgi:hypothetical protein